MDSNQNYNTNQQSDYTQNPNPGYVNPNAQGYGASQQNDYAQPNSQGYAQNPGQGYMPPQMPPQQGYMPPQQGYMPPQQGFMPPQQGYVPSQAQYNMDKTAPLNMGQYILMFILLCIPLLNIVLPFVWAFGDYNVNKKNFAKALLVMMLIGIVLSILFASTLAAIIASFAGSMKYY